MDGVDLYSIGELARRTGLSVRTIRFYSDAGVVAPACRSRAGYRLYDLDAVLRLELVCTLRELGLDLATVRRVLEREASVAEVAAAHVDALDVQIRVLRLRRAVLRVVAGRGSGVEELALLSGLARLSGEEFRRLVGGLVEGADPVAVGVLGVAAPELPDDPSAEQLAAWVELAALVGDEGFRAALRGWRPGVPEVEVCAGAELMGDVRRVVEGPGVEEGVVEELVGRFAVALGRVPGAEFRGWLAGEFAAAGDVRVERYFRLVWVVNGWEVVPGLVPVYARFAEVLAAG
ncbi:MerR family transcriptional regulator [Streptomyces sp. NPDC088762]|uniref:MerR family transcriptional regulator n=1 Tax=Streptomyces sp. NPDC088762 TaxID=3365891 RepID=UPI0038017372